MAEVQSGSENFLKAIEKYAEEQRNKIRFESESFKKLKQKELEKPIPLFKEKWQP